MRHFADSVSPQRVGANEQEVIQCPAVEEFETEQVTPALLGDLCVPLLLLFLFCHLRVLSPINTVVNYSPAGSVYMGTDILLTVKFTV